MALPVLGDGITEKEQVNRAAVNLRQFFLVTVAPPGQVHARDRHRGEHGAARTPLGAGSRDDAQGKHDQTRRSRHGSDNSELKTSAYSIAGRCREGRMRITRSRTCIVMPDGGIFPS